MIGRLLLLMTLILSLACSGERLEGQRLCIVNVRDDTTNSYLDALEIEANENRLEVEIEDNNVSVCGDPVDIDAVLGDGEYELLGNWLDRGRNEKSRDIEV